MKIKKLQFLRIGVRTDVFDIRLKEKEVVNFKI